MVTRWFVCVPILLVMAGQPCSVLAASPEPRSTTPIADSVARYAPALATGTFQVPLAPAAALHPEFAPRRAPRLLPVLVGAGIGAALFAGMVHGLDESRPNGAHVVMGALAGAGFGAGVGFVISTR